MPFEIKRGSSIISLITALIIAGFLSKVGEFLFDKFLTVISPIIPVIGKILFQIVSFRFEINITSLIVFALILFPVYRYFDNKLIQKKDGVKIFTEDFNNGENGWHLDYWGKGSSSKINRVEKGCMVFEAEESEISHEKKESGAYFDLKNGIYKDNIYTVRCNVRSDQDTTMKFRLWLHDTSGKSESVSSDDMFIPSNKFQVIEAKFVATDSNAMRIHLHFKAGKGKIYVDNVTVTKT